MPVPSRPFACCGTNRSWLLGLSIFFLILSILTVVVSACLFWVLKPTDVITFQADATKVKWGIENSGQPVPTPRINTRQQVLVMIAQGAQIAVFLLAIFAEKKKSPNHLLAAMVYMFLLLVLALLAQIIIVIFHDGGILEIVLIVYNVVVFTVLITVANRRLEELDADEQENSINEANPLSYGHFKTTAV